MSWLFSQALVAEYSADTSLAGELSAPSSGNPTQQAFLSHGKTTGFSRLSRFGMTCKPLTEYRGEALLMSYLAASRARTSAQPGGGLELTAPGPACGSRWPELSVRFDPDSSSWKTAHCLWEEALPWYSVTLPRWGMTRNGHVFQHPTAERPISETVYGLWPTPVKSDALVPFGFATMERKEKGESRPSGAKIGSQLTWDRRSLPYVVDGRINPILHQWLMEWPLGWTSLQPLEMARFHEWQQQHSPSFPESNEAA